MYSQQELDDAVASGVITAEAANALRAHVAGERSSTIPDDEQFRLLTGKSIPGEPELLDGADIPSPAVPAQREFVR